ncbi:MAG: hypothetical protein CMH26_01515 [Micavibrio sp.]|nr:hypothetical protein [Micavibrio sp.]|tara:strand:+ start:699 stop:893 length:195 start_codon:yes stop_codon:yes gene_type:complete
MKRRGPTIPTNPITSKADFSVVNKDQLAAVLADHAIPASQHVKSKPSDFEESIALRYQPGNFQL